MQREGSPVWRQAARADRVGRAVDNASDRPAHAAAVGTRVRTNTKNSRRRGRINDRTLRQQPHHDISEAAARRLDMIDAGVVPVVVEVLR